MIDLLVVIERVLAVGTREEAEKQIEQAATDLQTKNPSRDLADIKTMLLSNIGYYAGYYKTDTADRIYELFQTEHPFFGRRHPSAIEALARGVLYAYLRDLHITEAERKTVQELAIEERWHDLLERILGKKNKPSGAA